MTSKDLVTLVNYSGSDFLKSILSQALEREPVACLNELALVQNIIHTKLMEDKNDPRKGI